MTAPQGAEQVRRGFRGKLIHARAKGAGRKLPHILEPQVPSDQVLEGRETEKKIIDKGLRIRIWGLVCSPMVEHLPGKHKTLV